MAKKKKKNKQPAKKRNRGTLLYKSENMELKDDKVSSCNEIFLDNLFKSIENKENKINSEYLGIDNGYCLYNINIKKKKVQNVYSILFMPLDTRKNLIFKDNLPQIDNLALKINKFPFFELKNKYEVKAMYYNKYCTTNRELYYGKYYDSIKKFPYLSEEFELKTDWKLSIGLGQISVYETSLTLHHIYGVPYIPGSAIKGSFRSYIINEFFQNKEENALKEKWFVDIFGNETQQGKIIFFDSFSKDFKILKDIMNPHYPDYYNGDVPPTDDQNPIPINFLTVEGTFKFVIGAKQNIEIKVNEKKENILDFVKEKLKDSLKNFGIGAKTAVGYGYFD